MIIFATKNKGKLDEIRKMIPGIVSMTEAGIGIDVIEDGDTYEHNAMKKAEEIMKISGIITLADDSGLEIDFFDKKPGVFTSSFLTTNDRYRERNAKILEMMAETDNRTARFVSVIAMTTPNGERIFTHGYLDGAIAKEPLGEFGFAYDSIFFVKEYGLTLAQMSPELKNKISHRGESISKMAQIMKDMGIL